MWWSMADDMLGKSLCDSRGVDEHEFGVCGWTNGVWGTCAYDKVEKSTEYMALNFWCRDSRTWFGRGDECTKMLSVCLTCVNLGLWSLNYLNGKVSVRVTVCMSEKVSASAPVYRRRLCSWVISVRFHVKSKPVMESRKHACTFVWVVNGISQR